MSDTFDGIMGHDDEPIPIVPIVPQKKLQLWGDLFFGYPHTGSVIYGSFNS